MRTTEALNPTSLALYLRTARGLTQREVAESCGLTTNDVCRFELGHTAISYGKLRALANFYGISTDALFFNNFRAMVSQLRREPEEQELRSRIHRRQSFCENVGDLGEWWVAQLEREKLRGTPWAGMVNANYAGDPKAHFDLMSFDPDTGEEILIEVKATAKGPRTRLYFTDQEWDFLQYCLEKNVRYELHRVCYVNDPALRSRMIYTARDVLTFFSVKPQHYILRWKEGAA